MACFIEITFQFIFSVALRGSFVMSKCHCKDFLPSQIGTEVVVNIVCLSLVALQEKQQHGEPNISWNHTAIQTSPDICRGKSLRSGLPECPETVCLQVHQSISWFVTQPFHPTCQWTMIWARLCQSPSVPLCPKVQNTFFLVQPVTPSDLSLPLVADIIGEGCHPFSLPRFHSSDGQLRLCRTLDHWNPLLLCPSANDATCTFYNWSKHSIVGTSKPFWAKLPF